jgi:hypothetical protein
MSAVTRERKKAAPPRSSASCCAVGSVWLKFGRHLFIPSTRDGPTLHPEEKRGVRSYRETRGERHMVWSFGSLIRSAESSSTGLSLTFFHQCETSCVSATTSPVLCVTGTAQLLAYSTISPCVM